MTETVTAVYENGVLRPLRPLKVREHQTVRLQIVPEEPIDSEYEIAIRMLLEAGLSPRRLMAPMWSLFRSRNAANWPID